MILIPNTWAGLASPPKKISNPGSQENPSPPPPRPYLFSPHHPEHLSELRPFPRSDHDPLGSGERSIRSEAVSLVVTEATAPRASQGSPGPSRTEPGSP